MKKLVSVVLLSLPMVAAASNCDEISGNIAEKIQNNGVQSSQFQLKLVPADQSQQVEGQIVGSCDRGQQNIVYVRLDGVSAATKAATKATKAEAPAPEAKPVEQPKAEEPKTQAPAVESNSQPAAESTPASAPAETSAPTSAPAQN
ncbi:hypothetical protein A9G13_02585 [Gilliamella sp. wkB178]|uniref:DUF1161 domain-containing protein n=1 Tax=Gilliamella sp. wkB178 TaxID=3120259 RepID=UPI00080E8DB4|nr:DUF1161 domain-containing protein [Gilliamella apicola]OCG08964.1 hypothetical protein A9G13_02585 [Gilliamella apicola]